MVGGKPSLLRHFNEQALLEILRKEGPASQAQLSRRLRLSKSTISAVVQGLLDRGLVRRTASVPSPVGRRSTLLDIAADAGHVVGIDLGATWVRVAVADLKGVFRGRRAARTARSGLQALLGQLRRLIAAAAADAGIPSDRLLTAAIGVPGAVSLSDGTVYLCPNLPFLEGVPLGRSLEAMLGFEVLMDNDVNLAAIGEKWCGAGANVRNFAFLAIGTGIGVGLVLEGELYRGRSGFAGEIAYLPYRAGGRLVPLEDIAAGPAIVRLARRPAAQVFRQARAGKRSALAVLERIGEPIAVGIAALNALLDLDLIVLGGGVGAAADVLIPVITRRLKKLIPFRPEVRRSALGDEATLYGAVALALRKGRILAVRRSQPAWAEGVRVETVG